MGRKRGRQAVELGWRFGQNLVELRGRAGLSQIGTAERAGLNRTEINLLEHGRRVMASMSTVGSLAPISTATVFPSPLDSHSTALSKLISTIVQATLIRW